MNQQFNQRYLLSYDGKKLDLLRPAIMGILNITPDSFYDGGKFKTEQEILKQAEKMISEGADIIDVGAVSTRPEADEISEDEELKRLAPVIALLRKEFPDAILSIDTYRSVVAEKAIGEGIWMINDISGGVFDPAILSIVARYKIPYVMMHIKGTPGNMQNNPVYENVVRTVKDFFSGQLEKLKNLDVCENLILDPGFGFGKATFHNYQLLGSIASIRKIGYPVMAGVSRKSMINQTIKTKPDNALNGTTVLHTIALLNGADILRVHDVKEARQAVELVQYYKAVNNRI